MDNILTAVRSILESTPLRWQHLTGAIPASLLVLSPKPGEWSPVECLQHLVDIERWVFPVRVQAFLNQQDFPAFNPDTQGTHLSENVSPSHLADEFTSLRQASLELFARLSQDDLSLTARHAELGVVSLGELLHEWAAHDLDHTIQAERGLMQPFIQGCGPWQVFFKANTLG